METAPDKFTCSGEEWEPAGPRGEAVAVLMSGGVDSSVAAATLRRQGRDVVGITMLIPSGIGPTASGVDLRACCGTGASKVAKQIGVPHYFVDIREEFTARVLKPFREAYRTGRTPSPCIDCNTYVKFDAVIRLVREHLGIEQVATGHYARIVEEDGSWGLFAGVDAGKDQSYFLYGIRRDDLSRIVFPLGEQTKGETRRQADEWGLDAADRAESVELCFAGQGDYRAALGEDPDAGPGDVLDTSGCVIGRHRGVSQYTYGQRGGLGVAAGVPLYVVDIDPERNTVTLGDRDAASRRGVRAHKLNVLAPDALARGGRFAGKIRSRLEAKPCTVTELAGDRATVEFDEPEHGVTPGQHLVLYSDAGRVIAGGEIRRPRAIRTRECV